MKYPLRVGGRVRLLAATSFVSLAIVSLAQKTGMPRPAIASQRASLSQRSLKLAVDPLNLAGPVFATARDFAIGNDVTSVALGDFNGDGKPDLALSGGDTGGVTIMLSNGDGSFQSAKFYATDGNPASALVVGDFNNDGQVDLAIVDTCNTDINCPQSQVSVLLGHGDGTFGAAQSFGSGGILADSLAVGDFDGDGNLDLVVSNEQASSTCCSLGNIGILFGNGDGTFRPATVVLPGGSYPMGVNVADFNGDGRLDLAVTNHCSAFNCTGSDAGVVAIFLGNGDGTFQLHQTLGDGGSFPIMTATSDLNGDHKIDLVVAHHGEPLAQSGFVSVLLGNGDGTFQNPQNIFTGVQYTDSVLVADLNGDGKPDLAVNVNLPQSSFAFESGIAILLGKGDGTFGEPASYSTGGGWMASSAVAADFNGDGKIDLVVANQCLSGSDCFNGHMGGSVGLLLGKGQGKFRAARVYTPDLASRAFLSSEASNSLATADFNGDGNPDIVTANGGFVSVQLGKPDGTFRSGQSFSGAGSYVSSVNVADFNGDGKLDLAIASSCTGQSTCGNGSAGVSVLLGNGDGTFQPAQHYTFFGWFTFSVVVGDFNHDGKPDIAAAVQNMCHGLQNCRTNVVNILLGNGDGTFQIGQSVPSGGNLFDTHTAGVAGQLLAVADFNGDGKQDLAVVHPCISTVNCSNGVLRLLMGQGNGTFKLFWRSFPLGPDAGAVALGDFNGDGKVDIAAAGNATLTVLLGNGDRTFQPAQTYSTGGLRATGIGVADFNRDGKGDLFVANSNNSELLLGKGDGTFQISQTYNAGGPSVAVGDFNHDGRPDVALAGTIVLLNRCANVLCRY